MPMIAWAVSYTHLDGYKRQRQGRPPGAVALWAYRGCAGKLAHQRIGGPLGAGGLGHPFLIGEKFRLLPGKVPVGIVEQHRRTVRIAVHGISAAMVGQGYVWKTDIRLIGLDGFLHEHVERLSLIHIYYRIC